ncbi:S100 calcium binding protein T isoform X2 [Eucyclogobius newberryi]|uniref:S100 calcium binding protein T isoform X2 n=1 Tax=Eucyclogobius newberryi TaxID=166745 RepID=UPI003B5C47EE
MGGVKGVFKSCPSSGPESDIIPLSLCSFDRIRSPITHSSLRMSMPNLENASTLESAMQLLIQTFHKYSGNEGDKYTLSRAELKELLTTELGNYLGNAQDKEAVDKVMGDLDSNNDGEVDFTEFIILVGALTVACNDFFLEFNNKDQKKK